MAEYEAIFTASDDGLWITDAKGLTLQVNPAYEQLTGFPAAELEGRYVQDLVSSGKFRVSVVAEVMRHKKVITRITKSNNDKQLLVTGRPIFDSSGALWRIVCTGREVTELVRLQRELERKSQLVDFYQTELASLQARDVLMRNGLVANSRRMSEIIQMALKVANSNLLVLLTGESGVGKEVFADLIHRNSQKRKAHPFIKVNCAAIPEALIESEFFGYEQGSFTGAKSGGKLGFFEMANHGTLFLDEVGELPLFLQAKLLRVLQDLTVRRVGGTDTIEVDVRVIAATNQNLKDRVANGLFRADLFYRLSVVPLDIPPLRERREDIPALIDYYLELFNQKHGEGKTLDTGVLRALMEYDWPGNVRELRNLLERLVVLLPDSIITLNDLLLEATQIRETIPAPEALPPAPRSTDKTTESLRFSTQDHEARVIAAALLSCGSLRKAALMLGTSHVTLMRKARRYGISRGPESSHDTH